MAQDGWARSVNDDNEIVLDSGADSLLFYGRGLLGQDPQLWIQFDSFWCSRQFDADGRASPIDCHRPARHPVALKIDDQRNRHEPSLAFGDPVLNQLTLENRAASRIFVDVI